MTNDTSKYEPIEIYGPNGLYNYLLTCINTTGSRLHIPIIIYEFINPNRIE